MRHQPTALRNNKAFQRAWKHKHYLANREKMIARANARRDELRQKVKQYKLEHPCSCGESHPNALDFHHKGDDKLFCISTAISNGYSWDRIEPEIEKCDVICANCHRKYHWPT